MNKNLYYFKKNTIFANSEYSYNSAIMYQDDYSYPVTFPYDDYSVGMKEFEGVENIIAIESPDIECCDAEWSKFPEDVAPITVILPKSIKKIDMQAFANCKNLLSVSIPYSVKDVGYQSFYHCKNLEVVDFIEDLNKELAPNDEGLIIRKEAFKNCENLLYAFLPTKAKHIGVDAFANCKKLELITLRQQEDSLIGIGEGAFSNCESLTSIDIPKTVKYIWDLAFENCKSLKEIIITNPECKFGAWVFKGCSSLKSVTLPYPLTIEAFDEFVFETGTAFEDKDINLIIKQLFNNNPPELIKLVTYNNATSETPNKCCIINTKNNSKEIK